MTEDKTFLFSWFTFKNNASFLWLKFSAFLVCVLLGEHD